MSPRRMKRKAPFFKSCQQKKPSTRAEHTTAGKISKSLHNPIPTTMPQPAYPILLHVGREPGEFAERESNSVSRKASVPHRRISSYPPSTFSCREMTTFEPRQKSKSIQSAKRLVYKRVVKAYNVNRNKKNNRIRPRRSAKGEGPKRRNRPAPI